MLKIGLAMLMVAAVLGLGLAFHQDKNGGGRVGPGNGNGHDEEPGQRGGPAPENAEWSLATRPAGFIVKTLAFEGASYNYVVYAPREYHPQSRQRAWPTILFMHGSGECGDDGLKHLALGMGPAILWNRERWPFIVIFPQKPDPHRQWEEYDQVLMAMIDAVKKEYPIDPDRLYLTGLSQGGHGTWALAAMHPTMWAAIAPVCGYINGHGSTLDGKAVVDRIRNIPVWAFHGETDNVVPATETTGMIEAIKRAAAKGEPRATVYPSTGHNSWDKAYSEPDLAKWFLSQTRSGR